MAYRTNMGPGTGSTVQGTNTAHVVSGRYPTHSKVQTRTYLSGYERRTRGEYALSNAPPGAC